MKTLIALAALIGGLLSPPATAQPAAPRLVAVVEAVTGEADGIGLMDYVAAGQVIRLGPRDSIVLGYLKSCLRETISGGTVIVLEEQSLVQFGRVERTRVRCDSAHLKLNGGDAKESAGNVFRGGPAPAQPEGPPRLTLHGRSPIVEVDGRREPLVFQRTDQPAPPIEVRVDEATLIRGRFVDLAKAGIRLAAGASYAASQGAARAEFSIDAQAGSGATPVIGRLLRFP